MLFIRDILLIEMVYVNLLFAMSGFEKLEKVLEKLVAVFVDGFSGVFPHEKHLPHM
jgi:hypothetical protein